MAIIPSNIKFVGISPNVDTTERKSARLNSLSEVYTLQDFSDSLTPDLTPITVDGNSVSIASDPTATTQSTAVIQSSTLNSGIAIVPNGTGAITASIPDGTATGGNARGANAVDLQTNRTYNLDIASGASSVVVGGLGNRAEGAYSSILGGFQNKATTIWASVVGGQYNNAQGTHSFIGGGVGNIVTNTASTISGGESNTASTGTHATVVGGKSNTSSGQYSVSGGDGNTASGQGTVAFGRSNTSSSNNSTTSGGQSNTNQSTFGTISGGQSNTTSFLHATVVGGQGNTSSGQHSVSGGSGNLASGRSAVALGRLNNATAFESYAIGDGNSSSSGGGMSIGVLNNTSGGIRNYAFGQGNNVSSSGTNNVAIGTGNAINSGIYNIALATFADHQGASYSTSIGISPSAYLRNQFVHGSVGGSPIRARVQTSNLISYKDDTLNSAATTVLSLDGTGTTSLIIPLNNNRLWAAKVTATAFVNAVSGTTLVLGDSYMGEYTILFKRVGGTSSVVGVTGGAVISDTNMSTAAFTFSAGASQELSITFVAPTTASADTFRCVAKVELVEVAY